MASGNTDAAGPADYEPHVTHGSGEASGARWAFRVWRRSRPFWGGLLLMLGGLEMLLIPLTGVLARGQIKLVIYVGIGGVFGILIGALLIACGLALWFTPVHKTFYAIAGVLLSLLSFIGTNLGGFFIGMLLGIVGGSLAFAWCPGAAAEPEPARPPRHDGPPGTAQDRVDGRPRPGGAANPDDAPRADWGLSESRHRGHGRARGRRSAQPGWSGRALAVAALLGVAAAALTGTSHADAAETQPTQTQRAQSGQGCILFVICTPSPSPSPSPSASPSPSPSKTGSLGGVLPVPGVLPPAGTGLPTVSVPGPGSASTPGSGSASQAGGPDNKVASGTQGLVVASEPSVITASSATLNGLAYQGKVAMPVSGGGMVTMMKFTMTSQQLSGLDLRVTGAGGSLATAATSASFSGDVVLYTTKLTGQLAGIPLTLTPGNAESTLLQLLKSLTPLVPVTLTGVTADQPVVLGNSGAITSLSVTAS
jgi:hypothetical protein